MPFIGNQPALSYTSFAKQDFTTSATTSYTLDHPVTNENEIALFINFVRQEPTTAYTASGTSLTLTSATSASDDMYCVFLGKAVQTVNPPNSSVGNSQLDVSAINSQTAETSIAGGDEVLIYDTSASALRKMTRTNFVSGVGGDNTPAFQAFSSSSAQSIPHDSHTKITFTEEIFDTNNAYDATNSRFTVPTGEGGKYFIAVKYEMASLTNPTYSYIYVNGSGARAVRFKSSAYGNEARMILTLSAGDYVEGYTYQASGGAVNIQGTEASGDRGNVFEGFKLIGI